MTSHFSMLILLAIVNLDLVGWQFTMPSYQPTSTYCWVLVLFFITPLPQCLCQGLRMIGELLNYPKKAAKIGTTSCVGRPLARWPNDILIVAGKQWMDVINFNIGPPSPPLVRASKLELAARWPLKASPRRERLEWEPLVLCDYYVTLLLCGLKACLLRTLWWERMARRRYSTDECQ